MLWRREEEGHALAPHPEPAPGHRAGLKPFGGRLEKHSFFCQISSFQLAQPATNTEFLRPSAHALFLSWTLC